MPTTVATAASGVIPNQPWMSPTTSTTSLSQKPPKMPPGQNPGRDLDGAPAVHALECLRRQLGRAFPSMRQFLNVSF